MTLTTQRTGSAIEFGYLLVIESLPYAFTDIPDLIDSTTYVTGRTILGGLDVPESLSIESDPRGGMLEDMRATFGLVDYTGLVASTFAANLGKGALTELRTRIPPSDSPADATYGSNNVAVRGKYVNGEYIGTAGERRVRYITPADLPAGDDHVYTGEDSPVYVADVPHVFAGLRVGLHLLIKDKEDGDWGTWTEQYNSGSLIWFGQLVDRATVGTGGDLHTWRIECMGPDSWLRKTLNANAPDEFVALSSIVDLEDGEKAIGVEFKGFKYAANDEGGINPVRFQSRVFLSADDVTSTTTSGLRQEIADLVDLAIAGTGTNLHTTQATWDASPNRDASFSGGTATITAPSISFQTVAMYIYCHAKVAAAIGHIDDGYIGDGAGVDDAYILDARDSGTLSPGYVRLVFPCDVAGVQAVNTSKYPPDWELGAFALDPTARQISDPDIGDLFMEGQAARRPGAMIFPTPEIDGTDVDRMGWFWISGEVLRAQRNPNDPPETVQVDQVAVTSWRSGGANENVFEVNAETQVHIDLFEIPRYWGLDDFRITRPLVTGGNNDDKRTRLQAIPVARFGGYRFATTTVLDEVWRVVPRTLLASGTVGTWTNDITPPSPGDNQPSAATGDNFWAGDLEKQALGLNIPDVAVDILSWRTAAQNLPQGENGALASCLYCAAGPIQSDEIIRDAHNGRGWAVGLTKDSGDKHPAFRCWEPWRTVTTAEVEYTLTQSDLAASPENPGEWVPEWNSRPFPAVDEFVITAGGGPLGDGEKTERRIRSNDRGRKKRTGRVTYEIHDRGLMRYDRMLDVTDPRVNWFAEAQQYFGNQIGPFLASRCGMLRFRVSNTQGQFLWPGTAVRIDHPFAPALDGSGIGLDGALGRVHAVELVLKGEYAGSRWITVLVQEQGADTDNDGGRLWSPVGYVLTATDNGSNDWDLVISDDWLGFGHGDTDATGFTEPSGTSFGGTVTVKILQSFDGVTWGNEVTATIDSVTTGTDTIAVSVTAGTMYADTWKLIRLAAYDDQAASNWPRSLLSVHTTGDGTFGSGPTTGWRLD